MTGTQRLRIAVTVDPERPVPPGRYGGIERIVAALVGGLVERGHEVVLFCHPDSRPACPVHAYPGRSSASTVDLLRNMWSVASTALRGRYDIIHAFSRLAYMLPLLPLGVAKLMSYQRVITARSVARAERLARGTLHFAGCSSHLIRPHAHKPTWHVVYNCAARDAYHFHAAVPPDAPLVFLGRIETIKGVHVAIDVARRSNRRLIIAGNVPSGPEHATYFRQRVAPHINGGAVQYIGPATDTQKDELLGGAAALLFPILWEEPFGIVMAEALACGTPVIGLARGAVPEVVQDDVNGFACATADDMVAAVARVDTVDRAACRRIMEERFSDRAMVDAYEAIYFRLLGNAGGR